MTLEESLGAVDKIAKNQVTDKEQNENHIRNMLEQYGILYLYKQPQVVQNKGNYETHYPLFTLPQYDCRIIDYTPGLSETELSERINTYNYNRIPATLLGPENLNDSDWQHQLYDEIAESVNVTLYSDL